MIIRKDYNGNEFYNATDAAKYLGMPGSTFLYFYAKKNQLSDQFKPKYKISKGKRIWLITDLKLWKNKTSNLKFGYKSKGNTTEIFTKNTNITKFTKPAT